MASVHTNERHTLRRDLHPRYRPAQAPPWDERDYIPAWVTPGPNDAGPGLELIRRPSPEEWIRQRFPRVFGDYEGPIFKHTAGGSIKGLGPHMLFARCLTEAGSPDRPMVYCPALGGDGFLRYDPGTGLYEPLSEAAAWQEVDRLLEACGKGSEKGEGVHGLRETRWYRHVIDSFRGAGERPASCFEPRRELRHVRNGVLDLRTLELHPFSPRFPSLSKVNVDWVARPPLPRRFVGWLRSMFPRPDDRDLALSVMALALLGNPLQRLVVLQGPGGSGKSTWVKLLAGLLGPGASGQLRLDHVGSRFEAQRWVGKLLLHANEASGELSSEAAEALKGLSGQDPHEAEVKNRNQPEAFVPTALPILAANGRIKLPLNGDLEAWRRRLVVLEVSAQALDDATINEFEKHLLELEGPGILRLVASRACMLLEALDSHETSPLLTQDQRDRVDLLLGSFDPVRAFVESCVERCKGSHLYKGEARAAARAWLEERGYDIPSTRSLSRSLAEHVGRAGGVESNSLPEQPGHSARGWRQVRLVQV